MGARRIIGVTGGIGSGKTTVAAMLQSLGAIVVDADAVSRQTTQAGGAAMPQVAAQFGSEFVDSSGAMDRARMRQLVFTNPAAKQKLEAIVHPLVNQQVHEQISSASVTANLVVLDHPLLTESSHWRGQLSAIVVVDCSESTQVQRVMRRSGLSEDGVLRIIAAQAPRKMRTACADVVIYNDELGLAALELQVKQLARMFGL